MSDPWPVPGQGEDGRCSRGENTSKLPGSIAKVRSGRTPGTACLMQNAVNRPPCFNLGQERQGCFGYRELFTKKRYCLKVYTIPNRLPEREVTCLYVPSLSISFSFLLQAAAAVTDRHPPRTLIRMRKKPGCARTLTTNISGITRSSMCRRQITPAPPTISMPCW